MHGNKVITQLGYYVKPQHPEPETKKDLGKNSLSCGIATIGNVLRDVDKHILDKKAYQKEYPLLYKASQRAEERNLRSWEERGKGLLQDINFPLQNVRDRLRAESSLDKHVRDIEKRKGKQKLPSYYGVNNEPNLSEIPKLERYYPLGNQQVKHMVTGARLYQPECTGFLHIFIKNMNHLKLQKV